MIRRLLVFFILFTSLFGVIITFPTIANAGLTDTSGNLLPDKEWYYTDPYDVIERIRSERTSQTPKVDKSLYDFMSFTGILSNAAIVIQGDGSGDASSPTSMGAIGFFASNIGAMASNPPASSIQYTKYMANRLKVPLTPEVAYAAGEGGLGFDKLSPLLTIWTAMRNIAYFVFALIFIVIGVMIMLRVKIDPKTAVTIQGALPKIIVALILVTFSYPIAGFLIDLMYVAIGLILTVISSMGLDAQAEGVKKIVEEQGSIFAFAHPDSGLAFIGADSAFKSVNYLIQSMLKINPSDPVQLDNVVGKTFGFFIGVLAWLIILIAILWALVKTWFMLIMAYAQIILGIIFAPILLMFDAIPGQNMFGMWLRNMLSNLVAFPAVIVLMFVGLALGVQGSRAAFQPVDGFVPPLIGGSNPAALSGIIGLAILLTIPKTVEILQQLFKAPAFKFGNAWTEALGVGGKVVGGAASAGWQRSLGGSFSKEAEIYKSARQKKEQDELVEAMRTNAPKGRPTWKARVGSLMGGK